jgi:hypothetical protein
LPNAKSIAGVGISALCLLALLCVSAWPSQDGELKVAFAFRKNAGSQMALTRDSIGILAIDSSAGSLEPDDENGFESAISKRAFSPSERDTADMLFSMSGKWKGLKRYNCDKDDGYAFSIWTDSLSLHCNSCFSCTDGISVQEAKQLAKFGKLTLWLYQIRQNM